MEGKGLIAQIEERGVVHDSSKFTTKQLHKYLLELQEHSERDRVLKNKKRKEELQWLQGKSKELGEDIPWVLGYHAHTQIPCYYTDLIKMYPEWFKEIKPYIINRKYNEDALRDYFIKEYKNK